MVGYFSPGSPVKAWIWVTILRSLRSALRVTRRSAFCSGSFVSGPGAGGVSGMSPKYFCATRCTSGTVTSPTTATVMFFAT